MLIPPENARARTKMALTKKHSHTIKRLTDALDTEIQQSAQDGLYEAQIIEPYNSANLGAFDLLVKNAIALGYGASYRTLDEEKIIVEVSWR